MSVIIKDFQEAYESTVKKLKNNKQVISIVVYGSMVSGDIWEESDIDFLVITKEQNKLENIYTKVSNINVHINYISKEIFIDSYKNMLKGGTFHKAFFTGKLVYSSDDEIKDIHMSTRFYGDKDRDARNVEILCNLLNSMHYTKKYLITSKLETAYQWCIEVLTNYARLLMSLNGHITDKDILSFAVSVNDDIEYLFNILKSDEGLNIKINEILNRVDAFLDFNIEGISKLILDVLRDVNKRCSVDDLKNCDELKQVEGDLSLILAKLSAVGIVKENIRKYTTYGDEYLIDEIVYYVE